jgi:hypothetical protein
MSKDFLFRLLTPYTFGLDFAHSKVTEGIPSHYGREPVHQNDVLRNRSKARKLWKLLGRRLSAS